MEHTLLCLKQFLGLAEKPTSHQCDRSFLKDLSQGPLSPP